MKLKFLGAAERVTGSNYYLEAEGRKFLVDCGMFQGGVDAFEKNFEPFGFDPKTIDVVVVTHSHIDHIGRLPKLVKDGFGGRIYSSRPARDFAKIFLEDEFKIMSEGAEKQGKEPLWSESDFEKTFRLWESIDYRQSITVGGATIEFFDAGHILGGAIVKIFAEGKVIVFSGDLGNPPAPIIPPTEKIDYADFVVIESTYGGRIHEGFEERKLKLERTIEDIESRSGVLLIPAFAMERTQELLYEINDLVEHHRVRQMPVFVDSPLAIKATEIYKKYEDYFNKEAKYLISRGEDIFNFPGLIITRTSEESKKIELTPPPKVIIAGSGMSTGGRILFHERVYLGDPKNIILFVSYQVKGTLGRQIKDGAKKVKIMGEEIDVRAEVREISGYSAHADQIQLFDWISSIVRDSERPQKVFVTHGEKEQSEALAARIMDELGVEAVIPKENEEFNL